MNGKTLHIKRKARGWRKCDLVRWLRPLGIETTPKALTSWEEGWPIPSQVSSTLEDIFARPHHWKLLTFTPGQRKRFSSLLTAIMVESDWTVARLATAVEASSTAIYAWRRGSSRPTKARLERLETILGPFWTGRTGVP